MEKKSTPTIRIESEDYGVLITGESANRASYKTVLSKSKRTCVCMLMQLQAMLKRLHLSYLKNVPLVPKKLF